VSSHMPMGPDPMPLREALRGLRHVLRKGGQTFADTISTDGMPKPAAALANSALREAKGILHSIDKATSGLAKTVLGGERATALHLSDLPNTPDADVQFSNAVYVALSSVLAQIGAADVFISEAAARNAYRNAALREGDADATMAATLTLELLSARVLRGSTARQDVRVPAAWLDAVAVFAVLLWMQSERSDAENLAALAAATDLSIAVAAEVARACEDKTADQIAALYEKYVPHV
jgi:hypothetical protein